MVVTYKIDGVNPRKDIEYVIHRLERFFNDQDPADQIEVEMTVITNGKALEM